MGLGDTFLTEGMGSGKQDFLHDSVVYKRGSNLATEMD